MADENSYGWVGGVAAVLTAIGAFVKTRRRKPAHDEVESLRAEIKELKQELTEYKDRIEEMDIAMDKVIKEQHAMKRVLNSFDVSIDELRTLFGKVEEVLQSVRSTITKMKSKEEWSS
jgi:Chromosome segregation ATPases